MNTGNRLLEVLVAFGQRLDDEFAVLRPSHGCSIEVLLGLVEADVACVHAIILALVESLSVDVYLLFGHGTFAKLYPRTCAKDAFAILCHPGLQLVEECSGFLIVGAIGTQRDV